MQKFKEFDVKNLFLVIKKGQELLEDDEENKLEQIKVKLKNFRKFMKEILDKMFEKVIIFNSYVFLCCYIVLSIYGWIWNMEGFVKV